MRTVSISLLTLLLAVGCLAQGDKSKVTPTPDPNAPFKVYIPKDLEDAFVELKKMLSPALLNEIRLKSEDMVEYHHGFGTWLRNNWGLWAGSRLAQYFNQMGIHHPDDMSGIILTSFWRHLHSQPIKLEEQVEYYKEYWRKAAERENAITSVPETAMNSPLKTFNGKTVRLDDYKGKVCSIGLAGYILRIYR